MKNIYTQRSGVSILAVALVALAGCDDSITDFGFSGQISGAITDQAGNPVRGNTSTTDFRVRVLGQGELQPLEIRVQPDGTYQNTQLYPQEYSVWIEGPVVTQATEQSPVTVDLTGAPQTRDFTVTPFLTIATPSVGTPSGGSVDVSYDIQATAADNVANAVVWVSTASWPGPTTGNVVPDLRTHTIQTALTGSSGTATVTGLQSGRQYHVRIGAQATGTTLWNYSDQVVINTN